MTPQICISLRAAQGADYSLVRGDSCGCSIQPPPPVTGSTNCTTHCSGAAGLFCGNPLINAYSVFRRIVSPDNPIPLPQGPVDNTFKYGGCFIANAFIATAQAGGLVVPNSNIDACSAAATANGLRYLGLQGSTCYASNTAPSSSLEAGLGLCANPCPNDPTQACGGVIAQSAPLQKRQTANDANTAPLITLFEAAPPPPVTPAPTPDTSATGPTGSNGSFVEGCFAAGAAISGAYTYEIATRLATTIPINAAVVIT